MKKLFIICSLILAAAFFTSCEKETEVIPENLKVNDQQMELKSLSEFLKSGINLEEYFLNANMSERKNKIEFSSKTPLGDSELYDNMAELISYCPNLPTEDFEEAVIGWSVAPDPLDQYSSNEVFSPGDILPGISFNTTENYDPYDLSVFPEGRDGVASIVLFENNPYDKLDIDFTNTTQTVGMEIYSAPFTMMGQAPVTVEIYGASGILHTLNVAGAISGSGTFFGITTIEPIVKIRLSSPQCFVGVDNVIFGICDPNSDLDGDGVIDSVDNCPNTPNINQENYDGDSQGDVCDTDDDNDGDLDAADNCPFTSNSGQENYDDDSYGDVCDTDDDNDGCIDTNDSIDFSNMEITVNIDGCNTGVLNEETSTCGVMMSDRIDALEVATYTKKDTFIKAVTILTTEWLQGGLITKAEKNLILKCARNASY